MEISKVINSLDWLRDEIIGRNIPIETPFGTRPLVYADYTASGRSVKFIENYLQYLLQFYANTHTEDDFTGKTMTRIFHESEIKIKRFVNAGTKGKIIFTGTGATGGITRLLQILGLFWSPATEERIMNFLQFCKKDNIHNKCNESLLRHVNENRPIVFVGPYEHHSNEIIWRHTFCDIIEIPLNKKGYLDLNALEKNVSDPKYKTRTKIGSFSAASNVSGIKTPTYEVSRILHKHNAIACFDFAACAPYVTIDMNKDEESYYDAIFLSPHKFLGGPGSSGLLIFNENIYKKNLPPSISAGGTVDYVNDDTETYIEDIETREKPGTPGIIQAIKVALAFELKNKISLEKIDLLENYFLRKFYNEFKQCNEVIFYGPTDYEKKINIIPFNIKHEDRIFHPKFITKLLNDLFGIQTRAGCSCAGPYGHRLLGIDKEKSKQYNKIISEKGYSGLKPGWVRLNLHYAISQDESNYLISALKYIIQNAYKFLQVYEFNFKTGEWKCQLSPKKSHVTRIDIEKILAMETTWQNPINNLMEVLPKYIKESEELINKEKNNSDYQKFEDNIEKLSFFYVKNSRQ